MRILFLMVLFLFTHCNIMELERVPPVWEEGDDERMEEADIYLNDFNERYLFYQNNFAPGFHFVAPRFIGYISTYFTNLENKMSGYCEYDESGNRFILYDRDSWDKLAPVTRKQLVFHENGHCQLERGHKCYILEPSGLFSLMYPNMHSESYLNRPLNDSPANYWEESVFNYLELELFDGFYLGTDDHCPNW